MTRYLALILAYVFLALAILGLIIPGLPTVPFLLLAAWCAAKGSTKLHRWLYAHPQFGQLLIDWESGKSISRSSKIIALLMLLVSWIIMYQYLSFWILTATALLFSVVAAYLITRPAPTRKF